MRTSMPSMQRRRCVRFILGAGVHILGGYLADTYWGKYKTIHVAIVFAMFGHIILIVSALPPVIANPSGALGCFSVGLIFFGIGVGLFKANISPMIAEQYEAQHPRAVIEITKHGERVIVDPVLTISVIYMRYYFFINVGSLTGQISMGTYLGVLIHHSCVLQHMKPLPEFMSGTDPP